MEFIMVKEKGAGEYLIESKVNGNKMEVDKEGLDYIIDLLHNREKNNTEINNEYINFIMDPPITEERKDIFHVQWHLTDKCNLRCKHCYQMDYTEEQDSTYDENIEMFEKILQYTQKRGKKLEVSLTGGEPLLEKRIFDLIAYMKQKVRDIRIFILTNGTLLSEDIISQIKKYKITGIQISLDGSDKEVHDSIRGCGTFEKTINSIERLIENNIYTSIHTVLQKENIRDIDDMVLLCNKLKVPRLTFSRLVPIGNSLGRFNSFLSAEQIRIVYQHLYDLKQKFSFINLERDLWQIFDMEYGSTCPAGTSSITLLRDGTIVPCRRVPIAIGNIKERSLDEILFYSKTIEEFKNKIPEQCHNCKMVSSCKGGCQAIAFAVYRQIGKWADPQCWLTTNQKNKIDLGNEYEYISEKDYYIRKNEQIKKII